jgi:anaphase-promoting complex subunit 2
MLDERLLNKEKFSFDNELKNIELLKLRFGEQSMHNCVVMLRDIKDSERINNEVNK